MIELTIEEDKSISCVIVSPDGNVESLVTYESEANLPDDLKTKLAVLKMVDDTQEIKNVGQKVSKNIFWLDRFDDEVANILMLISMAEAISKKQSILKHTNDFKEELREALNECNRNVPSRTKSRIGGLRGHIIPSNKKRDAHSKPSKQASKIHNRVFKNAKPKINRRVGRGIR